jgi:hypothetical protein
MTKIELIASIKADLVARGVNLTGPCGAFEITSRVAWALRDEGFGLIAKNAAQNGCTVNGQRYAIDAIMLKDGQTFDILISAGGEEDANRQPIPGTGNGPAFQVTGAAPRESWRGPFEVDPVPPDPQKPDPVKPDPVKPDPVKPDPVKPDPVTPVVPGPLAASDVDRILAAQAADTERILAAIATLRQEASNLGQSLLPQLLEELLKRPR